MINNFLFQIFFVEPNRPYSSRTNRSHPTVRIKPITKVSVINRIHGAGTSVINRIHGAGVSVINWIRVDRVFVINRIRVDRDIVINRI